MRVLTDGRVRRTELEWRSILARYERSGLSESAFCPDSKLSGSTFMKWKRRLAGAAAPAPAFVEWIAPSGAAEEAPARVGEFELTLPGGVVLRWKA
jgi:hypothetical protein